MEIFEEKIQKGLWYSGIVTIIGGFLIATVIKFTFKSNISSILPGCLLWERFRLYCPGCGGTRAVIQLLHGHIWMSFRLHPVVPYTAVIFVLFMSTSTAHYLGKCNKRFLLRPIYFYFAIGIIICQWILKNILIWQGIKII